MIQAAKPFRHGNYLVELIPTVSPEREKWEERMLESGVPLPLSHRCAWAKSYPSKGSYFLAIRDLHDRHPNGFAIELNRTRALPGHVLFRIQRFGAWMTDDVREAGLAALVDLARRDGRVLRINAEIFSTEAAARRSIADSLNRLGFVQLRTPRGYSQTVTVDLTPGESQVFSSFRGRVRRSIRQVAKSPVEVRPITDTQFAQRIHNLLLQAVRRTGGVTRPYDWCRWIEMSNLVPHSSRLVGLFHRELSGTDSLLAFAWGCHNGDHAHYEKGGSTRSADVRIPMAYALLWDLICWARRYGARWFDMGGITQCDTADVADPLGHISEFKRSFSQQVIQVGEEWIFEPHPFRARLAHAVSASATWLSSLRAQANDQ